MSNCEVCKASLEGVTSGLMILQDPNCKNLIQYVETKICHDCGHMNKRIEFKRRKV